MGWGKSCCLHHHTSRIVPHSFFVQVLQLCVKIVPCDPEAGQDFAPSHKTNAWGGVGLDTRPPVDVWIAARCNYEVNILRARAQPTPNGRYHW